MCTVSWLRLDGGYALLSNRDEKLTRLPAATPSIRVRRGVRYAAPTDNDFGGSWIATNECGVSACLLNGASPRRGRRSRGEIVEVVASSRNAEEAWTCLQRLPLGDFGAFVLLVFQQHGVAVIFEWSGESLSSQIVNEPCGLLTSSSFALASVRNARERAFRRRSLKSMSALADFHASHDCGRSAWSVCMHRDDAATVSLTRVLVTSGRSSITYQSGAPCEQRSAVVQVL